MYVYDRADYQREKMKTSSQKKHPRFLFEWYCSDASFLAVPFWLRHLENFN